MSDPYFIGKILSHCHLICSEMFQSALQSCRLIRASHFASVFRQAVVHGVVGNISPIALWPN